MTRRPAGSRGEPEPPEDPWTIERIVPGGVGIARLADGRVGFAGGVAPGDRIQPLRVVWRSRHATAEQWRLLQGGPDRVEPPCPWLASCGACDLMHLADDAQRAAKKAIVEEALRRTGGLDPPPDVAIVRAGPTLGYRSRVRLHVSHDGRVGFHARGTHDVVVPDRCAVCTPGVEAGIASVRVVSERHRAALGAVAEVEVREAPGDARLALRLHLRPHAAPTAVASLAVDLRRLHAVTVTGERRRPDDVQRWPLADGVVLEAPAAAFTQVNAAVNERLVAHVVEGCVSRGARTFCDLFGGAGNFSLPLLARGLTGVLVERSAIAAGAARHNARRAGGRLEVVEGDAAKGAADLVRRGRSFDVVVLDPPRTGAKETLIPAARLARRSVAYCSCDPVTLARDLASLRRLGWIVQGVTAFDMFPQTHHVEVVAWLAPAGAAG